MNDSSIEKEIDVVKDKATEASTNLLSIEDFFKVQLVVGRIISVAEVPKSNKLLCLKVDLGPTFGLRQILAGIAKHYDFADLVDRKVVIVANLNPAKLMGLESQGMLLASSAGDKVIILDPGVDAIVGERVS
jgi:methionyl-tRNA synthetase